MFEWVLDNRLVKEHKTCLCWQVINKIRLSKIFQNAFKMSDYL